MADQPADRENLERVECARRPRADENADDDWRAVSDGLGERALLPRMARGLPVRAGVLAALIGMAAVVTSYGAHATPTATGGAASGSAGDPGEIVFASNLSPAARLLDGRVGALRLHAFSADGRARVDFSNGIGKLSDGQASLSPDGRTVAFVRFDADEFSSSELWVANEDGSGARRLLVPEPQESFAFEGFPGLWFQAPAWSPDGTRLAVDALSTASCLSGYTKCASWYTVLVDVSGRRLGITGGLNASWSPDGRFLLALSGLFSLEDANTWELVVVESAKPNGAAVKSWGEAEKRRGACWHGGSWSPDGSRLLLAESRCDDELEVARLHVIGTRDWAELARLDGCCSSWLGPGAGFTYVPAAKNSARTVVTPDGTRPIPGAKGALSVRWSPSGRRLAYVRKQSGHLELIVARGNGTRASRIAVLGRWTSAWINDWSRDERSIVLTFRRGSAFTIATVQLSGGQMRLLQRDLEGAWDVVVGTTAGGRVVVQRAVSGLYPDELWIVRPDGSHLRRLTSNRSDANGPAWSLDGSQIAFWRDIPGKAQRPEKLAVYTVPSTGGAARLVVGGPRGAFASHPAWAPDGRHLAFARWPDANHQNIYTVRTDGQGLRRITSTGHAFAPAWSPDGRTIAFSDDGRLTTVASTGGRPTALGDKLLQNCSGFDWSPDGSLLAAACGGRLLVLDRNGGVLRTLATDAGSPPSWSPDGGSIVYESEGQLKVVAAEGGTPTVIDLHGATSKEPDWGSLR